MSIEVRLLGPFEVLSGGRPLQLPGNRLRTLVAVLAMSAGRPVSIETIGEALWGSKPPANLQATVYTNVARLRQLLGEDTISTGEGMYGLGVPPDAVDALRFQRLADEADVSALALWRGQPFLTLRSDWLEDRYAAQLTDAYLGLLEHRIDLDLAEGRATDLVAELSALVEHHPLRESLWTRLLIVLDRSGRPAEALERYESIRRRLATDLAIDPGPELRQIHADLLAADAIGGQPFNVPRQLPSDIERFTGRLDILEALDELLPAGHAAARPIVIAAVHGTAGIGKTALAVHWAHRVRRHFPDGQLFINLRGYSPGQPVEPAAALDTLLRGLGVPGQQIPDDVTARRTLLQRRLAGKQVLIVLDNARDAAQVLPLLPSSAGQVVVTSRSQLRELDAHHDVILEQLTPAESVDLLTKTLPHRSATYDESLLADLADLCGHLPLALTIAAESASRHPQSGLAEVVQGLRDRHTRLDTLDIHDPAINPRVVFSWSYDSLDPEAARSFRLLAVHPGPDFGARSVAALVGTPVSRATELLDRLIYSHLVRRTSADRCEMHDLLRTYASELCDEKGRDTALTRVYDWYLHSAANARRMMGRTLLPIDVGQPQPETHAETFDADKDALNWFDREWQVLVALVRQAAAEGNQRAAYGVAQMVSNYLAHTYRHDELFALQQLASVSADRMGDKAAAATCANILGALHQDRMEYPQAMAYYERAITLCEAVGDDIGRAVAIGDVGSTLRYLGRPEDAARWQLQSIELHHRIGNPAGEARTLNNLAFTYLELNRPDEAVDACRRAVEIQHERGNRHSEAISLDSLGMALAAQGDNHEAMSAYESALVTFTATGNLWQECNTLANLGHTQHALGLIAEARASWTRALAIYDELGASDTPELRRADLVAMLARVS